MSESTLCEHECTFCMCIEQYTYVNRVKAEFLSYLFSEDFAVPAGKVRQSLGIPYEFCIGGFSPQMTISVSVGCTALPFFSKLIQTRRQFLQCPDDLQPSQAAQITPDIILHSPPASASKGGIGPSTRDVCICGPPAPHRRPPTKPSLALHGHFLKRNIF